jgi:hypothetical protein
VVNVYRLITRGTLEEKVMGLQKFKLNIANTVVTTDNSSLKTMDTGQLLDLFAIEVREEARRPVARHSIAYHTIIRHVLIQSLTRRLNFTERLSVQSFGSAFGLRGFGLLRHARVWRWYTDGDMIFRTAGQAGSKGEGGDQGHRRQGSAARPRRSVGREPVRRRVRHQLVPRFAKEIAFQKIYK